jgi:hypothetical protein
MLCPLAAANGSSLTYCSTLVAFPVKFCPVRGEESTAVMRETLR